MVVRAGPVRGHQSQKQARANPYARPAPAAAQRGAGQSSGPSLFTRIKRFIWGSPRDARRQSGPVRLLPGNNSVARNGDDEQVSKLYSTDTSEAEAAVPRDSEVPVPSFIDESSFVQQQHQGSDTGGDVVNLSTVPDIAYYSGNGSSAGLGEDESTSSTGSRIVHATPPPRDRSSSANVSEGPNEALRQFFEEKGDAELSNMEIVGVLSLIGQAVSRNESLIDFSQGATTSHGITIDETPNDTSILRGIAVPPTPHAYISGTPPPSNLRSRVNSPWAPVASPERSRNSARHSLGYGRRSSITPRSSGPYARPSATTERQSRSSLSQPISQPSALRALRQPPSSRRAEEVTPAASAILRALDGDGAVAGPVLSRDARPQATLASSAPFFPAGTTPTTTTPNATAGASNTGVPSAASGLPVGISTPAKKDTSPEAKTVSLETSLHPDTSTNTPMSAVVSGAVPMAVRRSNKPTFGRDEQAFAQVDEPSSNDMHQSSVGSAAAAEDSGSEVSPVRPTFGLHTQPTFVPPEPPKASIEEQSIDATPSGEEGGFVFEIPKSAVSREMTPAEEQIVAKSSNEFTF